MATSARAKKVPAKTTSKSKEVAKPDEAGLPAEMYEGADETGFEGTGSDDYSIPFIKILQTNSPECDKDDGAYIKGAEQGLFLNTATNEMSEEITVIPCYYLRAMVEWHPREEGGGYAGQHPVGYEQGMERDDRGRYQTGHGTYLVDTRYFFCLIEGEEGDWSPVVISLSSTQTKKGRNWLTRAQAVRFSRKDGSRGVVPLWGAKYKCTTKPESNDQGNWRGWVIEFDGLVDAETFAQARDAREMFRSSADNVKPPEGRSTGEAPAAGQGEGDEIPF